MYQLYGHKNSGAAAIEAALELCEIPYRFIDVEATPEAAKALEKLTGADVGRLLPIPDVSNKKFPEAMKHEAEGLHTIMWHWSTTDYHRLAEIWNGPHPEDGLELEVRDEMPPGFPWPDFPEEPQLCAPGEIDPEMLNYYAKKLS